MTDDNTQQTAKAAQPRPSPAMRTITAHDMPTETIAAATTTTHHHGHHHHAPVETFMRGAPKVGRNDACPCGSGKKYKKCCLAA